MNRRKFLLLSGAAVSAILSGCWRLLDPKADPTPTAAPTSAPTQTPAPTTTETPSPTATPTDPPITPIEFYDDFDDSRAAGSVNGTLATDGHMTRITAADTAGQISISGGSLRISGVAPAGADPLIYANGALPCSAGQTVLTRFQVSQAKTLSRLGLVLPEGGTIATLRRTTFEGTGGVLECGGQASPVLNLYSRCWYDLAMFFKENEAAFALNDGSGLELVQVAAMDNPQGQQILYGHMGYCAVPGDDQDASIDFWAGSAQPYFPPAIAAQARPPADYEADLGTNAAWVEVKISRPPGSQSAAGLRIRSQDTDHEYRVYLDNEGLMVDQVIDGSVKPLATQPVDYRPGAKLAVRYNELTLTVYYDEKLVGLANRKIGATQMIAATKAGIYSTGAGSIFSDFTARPVRLEVPDSLRERLLASRQVLCLGDSLTNGDKANGYQNRLRKSLGNGWVTVDCGVGGQVTSQMRARLPIHLEHYGADLVVVMGGTNDVYSNFSAALIKANLQAIYTAAKKAGARVAAVTIPPLATVKGWTADQQSVLREVNAWIMGDAGMAANVDFRIDAYVVLANPLTEGLIPTYDSGDHIHFSSAGYNALADAIYLGVKW